jgi:hypothetical protein
MSSQHQEKREGPTGESSGEQDVSHSRQAQADGQHDHDAGNKGRARSGDAIAPLTRSRPSGYRIDRRNRLPISPTAPKAAHRQKLAKRPLNLANCINNTILTSGRVKIWFARRSKCAGRSGERRTRPRRSGRELLNRHASAAPAASDRSGARTAGRPGSRRLAG